MKARALLSSGVFKLGPKRVAMRHAATVGQTRGCAPPSSFTPKGANGAAWLLVLGTSIQCVSHLHDQRWYGQ